MMPSGITTLHDLKTALVFKASMSLSTNQRYTKLCFKSNTIFNKLTYAHSLCSMKTGCCLIYLNYNFNGVSFYRNKLARTKHRYFPSFCQSL